MRSIRNLLIVALALLMITACSPNEEPLPTRMQFPTVTLADMPAEVTESPQVTPVAADALPQTFSGFDFLGREIAAQYPAEWVVSDLLATDGALVMSNSQSALDNPEATLESGAILVTISAIPAEFAMDEQGNVQSLVDLVRSVATESEAITTVNEFMLSEFNAAQANFTGEQGDLLVIVMEQANGFVIVAASTLQGEMSGQQATVLGIASTVQYIVPTFE